MVVFTSGIVDDRCLVRLWPLARVGGVEGYLLPHVGGGWGQAHCWVLKNQPAPLLARVLGVGGGVWLFWSSLCLSARVGPVGWGWCVRGLVGLLFEICIVDASIYSTRHVRLPFRGGRGVGCC